MKLFRCSNGMVMSFGFDVHAQKADPHLVCWSHIDGATWEPGKGLADKQWFAFEIATEFIRELADQTIVAYQPGLCLEFIPRTDRAIFSIRHLKPDATI